MKGTLTFYLPLERNAATPPEIALVIRRPAQDRWHAGLAVCSRQDQFEKKRGRIKAEGRLKGGQFVADSPRELVNQLGVHLSSLTCRRPHTTGPNTLRDLHALKPRLQGMKVL